MRIIRATALLTAVRKGLAFAGTSVGMEVVCDNCGDVTEKKPCRVERSEHDFCSRGCSDEYQKVQFQGEGGPNYRGGGEYTCKVCGETKQTTPSKADERKYCSQECMAEDYKQRESGEGNPMWNGGLDEITCEWCGETAEFVPAEAEVRRFCSARCYKDWLSEDRAGEAWMGEDNPAYVDGRSRDRRYGPNWSRSREKALDRDDHECLMCGSESDLNVHHKKPIHTFDKDRHEWWKEANALKNLITLCRSCHMKVHQHPGEYLFDYIG